MIPQGKWKNDNIEIVKPPNYKPGIGTGFVPGETYLSSIENNEKNTCGTENILLFKI